MVIFVCHPANTWFIAVLRASAREVVATERVYSPSGLAPPDELSRALHLPSAVPKRRIAQWKQRTYGPRSTSSKHP